MGAWGINTFENDHAMDWLGGFLDDPSEERITAAFSGETATQSGFLARLLGRTKETHQVDLEGEEVLAAAEVVASLLGKPSDTNPDELGRLPMVALSPQMADKSKAAIDSILSCSNLKDCWEETDDYDAWKATVESLRKRLN